MTSLTMNAMQTYYEGRVEAADIDNLGHMNVRVYARKAARATHTLITALGLDGPALLDAAESEAVKAAFAADTQEAIDRGVFGAPSYVYKDEIFWGQDRLDFVERALARD